jgi:hypothetical protein
MRKPEQIRGALDILEEAVHLVRRIPLALLLQYYIGTFPFVLGFLYFWADMSRGAFAQNHVAESALGVSFLYIWMKCWQSVFCIDLLSFMMEQEQQTFSFRRVLRLLATNLILQPYAIFAIPISALLILPFGWTIAFFQSLLVVGDGMDMDLRRLIRRSWKLASLWPAQNHRILIVLTLFTGIVFLNLAILLLFGPGLLKTLFGIETVFTLSGFHALNTTFLSVLFGFTYLCVDLLLACVYTLRAFYGESLESGADLASELKAIAKAS